MAKSKFLPLSFVFATSLAAYSCSGKDEAPASPEKADAKPAAVAPSPETDASAEVSACLVAYVDAFNEQDVDTLSAMWTEDATHTDLTSGSRTEGRAAIQADLAAAFQGAGSMQLSNHLERVWLIQPEVAKVEGQAVMELPGEQPTVSLFTAILVKKEGAWLIHSLEEMPVPSSPSAASALSELEWLVGTWVDDSDQDQVETSFRFSPERAFLIRTFVSGTADGRQIIGWDSRSQGIRSWSFHSDGSFGDGSWSKNGEDWLIQSSQTLADGRAASGTYVLSRIDDDTISLQLIGHEIDGAPQPAGGATLLTRKVSAEPVSNDEP